MERLENIINEYVLDLLFEINDGDKDIKYIEKQLLLLSKCKNNSMKLLEYSNDELFYLIDKLKLSNASRIKGKLNDCRSLKTKFFKFINAGSKRSWINDFLDELVETFEKQLLVLKKETVDKMNYNRLNIAKAYDVYSIITFQEKKKLRI